MNRELPLYHKWGMNIELLNWSLYQNGFVAANPEFPYWPVLGWDSTRFYQKEEEEYLQRNFRLQ